MCVLLFYTTLENFFILRSIQRGIVIKVLCLHLKYPLRLSNLNQACIFSTDFRNILNIKFRECSLGNELFHADR
jgi:hypothetical protein